MEMVKNLEKLLFWSMAGIISTFFAEVISGSTPFPFFTLAGWLIVFPMYALHTVVLASIVLKFGKPTLYALYPAGMIFGMYETYITKVVWGGAEWGSSGPSFLGIYLIPFFLVVLFWHPFMSFIIPLTISENSLTKSRTIISYLPKKITSWFSTPEKSKKLLIYVAVLFGLMGMFNLDVITCLLSSLSSGFFVLIAIFLWEKVREKEEYKRIPPRQAWVFHRSCVASLILYILRIHLQARIFATGRGSRIHVSHLHLSLPIALEKPESVEKSSRQIFQISCGAHSEIRNYTASHIRPHNYVGITNSREIAPIRGFPRDRIHHRPCVRVLLGNPRYWTWN